MRKPITRREFLVPYILSSICSRRYRRRTRLTRDTCTRSRATPPSVSSPNASTHFSSALGILISYTILSIICVALGSPPSTWPPIFTSPFSATSLGDFWSHRWHAIFRRNFDRLSHLSHPPRAKSFAINHICMAHIAEIVQPSSVSDLLFTSVLSDVQFRDWFLEENRLRLTQAFEFVADWCESHKLP